MRAVALPWGTLALLLLCRGGAVEGKGGKGETVTASRVAVWPDCYVRLPESELADGALATLNGVPDEDACFALCSTNADCYGATYQTAAAACKLSTTVTPFTSSTKDAPGQVLLVPCVPDSDSTLEPYLSHRGMGTDCYVTFPEWDIGYEEPWLAGFVGNQACWDECISRPTCTAITSGTQWDECYWSQSPNSWTARKAGNAYQSLMPCTPGLSFRGGDNTTEPAVVDGPAEVACHSTYGGMQIAGQTSLADFAPAETNEVCFYACQKAPGCTAAMRLTTGQCWLISDPQPLCLMTANANYDLMLPCGSVCLGATSTPEPSYTTTPQRSSTAERVVTTTRRGTTSPAVVELLTSAGLVTSTVQRLVTTTAKATTREAPPTTTTRVETTTARVETTSPAVIEALTSAGPTTSTAAAALTTAPLAETTAAPESIISTSTQEAQVSSTQKLATSAGLTGSTAKEWTTAPTGSPTSTPAQEDATTVLEPHTTARVHESTSVEMLSTVAAESLAPSVTLSSTSARGAATSQPHAASITSTPAQEAESTSIRKGLSTPWRPTSTVEESTMAPAERLTSTAAQGGSTAVPGPLTTLGAQASTAEESLTTVVTNSTAPLDALSSTPAHAAVTSPPRGATSVASDATTVASSHIASTETSGGGIASSTTAESVQASSSASVGSAETSALSETISSAGVISDGTSTLESITASSAAAGLTSDEPTTETTTLADAQSTSSQVTGMTSDGATFDATSTIDPLTASSTAFSVSSGTNTTPAEDEPTSSRVQADATASTGLSKAASTGVGDSTSAAHSAAPSSLGAATSTAAGRTAEQRSSTRFTTAAPAMDTSSARAPIAASSSAAQKITVGQPSSTDSSIKAAMTSVPTPVSAAQTTQSQALSLAASSIAATSTSKAGTRSRTSKLASTTTYTTIDESVVQPKTTSSAPFTTPKAATLTSSKTTTAWTVKLSASPQTTALSTSSSSAATTKTSFRANSSPASTSKFAPAWTKASPSSSAPTSTSTRTKAPTSSTTWPSSTTPAPTVKATTTVAFTSPSTSTSTITPTLPATKTSAAKSTPGVTTNALSTTSTPVASYEETTTNALSTTSASVSSSEETVSQTVDLLKTTTHSSTYILQKSTAASPTTNARTSTALQTSPEVQQSSTGAVSTWTSPPTSASVSTTTLLTAPASTTTLTSAYVTSSSSTTKSHPATAPTTTQIKASTPPTSSSVSKSKSAKSTTATHRTTLADDVSTTPAPLSSAEAEDELWELGRLFDTLPKDLPKEASEAFLSAGDPSALVAWAEAEALKPSDEDWETFQSSPKVSPRTKAALRSFKERNCQGEWKGQWSQWSECPATCGRGNKTRTRERQQPDCAETEQLFCHRPMCPVHCEWSAWAPWSACSRSCGEGAQKRYRVRAVEAAGGGRPCEGPNHEQQACEGTACVEPTVPPDVAESLAKAGIEVSSAEEPGAFATAAIDSIPFFLGSLSTEEKMAMGHTLVSTVPMCTYNGVRCPISDFETFYDESLGNCFTFNQKPPFYQTQRPGALTGLVLLLQSSQSDYLCTSQLGGFKIVVHNQTERPFADSDGFNVAPGTTTSVALSQVELHKQPPPYGECTPHPSAEFLYNGSHTMEGCLRSCYQASLLKLCGCSDPRYAMPKGATPCQPGQEKLCLDKYLNCRPEDKSRDPLACAHCQDPCDRFHFAMTVSTGSMVETAALNSVCAFGADMGDACGSSGSKSRNFAELRVYYERLNLIRHSEMPAYDATNLISDVAGVLGITIGLSVITMTEFLFALADVVFNYATNHSFLK